MPANQVKPHRRPLRPKAETDEEISRTVQKSQYARSGRMAAITQGDAAARSADRHRRAGLLPRLARRDRSEEHTSELQSQSNLVCRLLLEKKKKNKINCKCKMMRASENAR